MTDIRQKSFGVILEVLSNEKIVPQVSFHMYTIDKRLLKLNGMFRLI